MFIRGFSDYWDIPRSGAEGSGEAADPAAPPAAAADAGGNGSPSADPAAPAEGGEGAGPSQVASPPSPAGPDWRDRRIARLTAQLNDERRRAASPASPGAAPPAEGTAVAEAEIERRANERAALIASTRDFNSRCEAAAEAGVREFGQAQFMGRVKALTDLVDRNNPQEAAVYDQFLDAAIEAGGHRVLYELGADLDEASRILAMTPARMGAALTKLAVAKGSSTGAPSNAPRPVTPVSARGGTREVIDPGDKDRADTLDTVTWMARREEALARRSVR